MKNSKLGLITMILLFTIIFSAEAFAAKCIGEACQKGSSEVSCGGCFFMLLFVMAVITLNIFILVWVFKDAKRRGMDSVWGWVLIVGLLGFIGLIVYFFCRPKGDLINCNYCNKEKLADDIICPHCGREKISLNLKL